MRTDTKNRNIRLTVSNLTNKLVVATSVVLWGLMLWYGSTFQIPQAMYSAAFLGLSITVYSLIQLEDALDSENDRRAGVMGGLTITGVLITVFTAIEFHNMLDARAATHDLSHYVLAVVVIAAVLYLTYDAFGAIFSTVVLAGFVYAYFGPYFPSIFFHSGMSGTRILEVSVINIAGIYGNLTEVGATMVAPFLLFAGLIKGFGGFGVILGFSFWIGQYLRTGVAQVAVVMSMCIGSISGSAAANTSISGSFTIPMMKQSGVDETRAAAIESVASSGGQILPPVMGVAAFLMADLMAVPIITIFTAAFIPAVVFYIVVANGVRWAALKDVDEDGSLEVAQDEDADLTDNEMVPIVSNMSPLLFGTQFVISVIYLVYALGVQRLPVIVAGNRTVMLTIALGIIYVTVDQSYFSDEVRSVKETSSEIYSLIRFGMIDGAKTAAAIMIIISAIGAVIDILLTTGFPTMLSLLLTDIAGDSFFLLLVITMIAALLLGLGMPTPAAYLIVAILLAPTLVQQGGIPEMNAHFFVFYYAILSAVTPPIAVGIIIAASIANANFWRTCVEALSIAIPLFILPFSFIYYPELIAQSIDGYSIAVLYGVVVLIALLIISFGLNAAKVPFTKSSDWKILTPFRSALLAVGTGILALPIFIV